LNIEELFNEAKNGSKEAEKELFSILLVRFRAIAFHIIGNWDMAQDIAHDAMLNVLRSYRKLEVHTSFIAWAQTVIRRQAIEHAKKISKERSLTKELDNKIIKSKRYDISPLVESRMVECLKSMADVDQRYVRILNLKYMGYTFEEICKKLKISQNNAYVLLHRARKALLSCLEKDEM
jgi:RNA polymerase sigma factor (sigma-70 family)